jgi:ribonuclease E
MAKEICISSTPHETRLAILEDDLLTEIYYERENEYTLAGSIYKGRVTRVLPGMQSAFVDVGLERDAFLYVTDFMEEQEDSADFEKVSNGNGGSRPQREGHAENRSARNVAPHEAESRAQSGGEGRSSSSSPAGGEDDQHGTRRWRGRRGRRRGGRPGTPREAGQPETQTRPEEDPASGIAIEVETGFDSWEHVDLQATAPAPVTEAPARKSLDRERSDREGSENASYRAPSQPIVLPGESLSRYGGKPAEAAPRSEAKPAPAVPVVSGITYKPTTLVEEVANWDGGAELPGESLSRHRKKPATAEVTREAEPAQHSEPEQIDVPHHSAEAFIDAPVIDSTTEEVPTETSIEAVAVETIPAQVSEPAEESAAAVETETHPVKSAIAPEPAPLVTEAPAEEVTATTEDFEPSHASASHRVAPAGSSEYRLSAFAEEEEVLPQAESESPIAEQAEPSVHSHAHVDHTVSEEAALAEPILAESEAVAEPLFNEAPQHVSAEWIAEPVEPAEVKHEVVAEAGEVAEASAVLEPEFETSEDEAADGTHGFAPGIGTLEEEIIDEEEYDFEPIRAQSDEHDFDDLEEETLDNIAGSEIGEMVRDTHLEQRISTTADGVIEDEESDAEYGEAEADLDEEDESEDTSEEQAASAAPAPSRRSDDGRRGRGSRRRGGRPNGGGGGGGSRRASAQLSDLPIISELLKQGQEILVQIAKEPIAKKGARITSHIALPGRFLVFMPTVNHVGVSRKIASDEERQRLKRILISEKGTALGGFIVRTAADGASEDDLRADIRFLINLWTDIKQRADESKAPALIYHDLNLVERVLRDQVSANFSTIWVDNEVEYERILRFLQRFEPSLVRRVKLYTKEMPLFEQFGIQDEITKALKSKVWLKSGGSIVINQTEALVAIDINTGKYVGKTARLEDTILKTNLDAIPEIVRQIRLRDLGGIIVIDFIDMDDRKNRHKVMAALEEELKFDRAPSKVLQFNDFGLVAITRKRVKQSLERTLSVPCEICTGTGMVKSPTTVCNEIYVELRKMQRYLERGDVLLRVNPEVVKTLKSNNARWLNEMEEMSGKTIIVKSDPTLHPEQFDIQ